VLAQLEKDPDAIVSEAARVATQSLRNYRFMNPDKPY
jgi:hypothetical protein